MMMTYPKPIDDQSYLINSSNHELLQQSAKTDPNSFWLDIAKRLEWINFPTIVGNWQFQKPVSIKWFEDGLLNVCANCVDRHAR